MTSNALTEEQQETLTALQSVFPELRDNKHSTLKVCLPVEVRPQQPITLSKVNSQGSVIDKFETTHVDGFDFLFGLPLTKDNFNLSSKFVNTAALSKAKEHIFEMIDDSVEGGYEDTITLPVCDYLAMEMPMEMEAELLFDYNPTTTSDLEFQEWKQMAEEAKTRHFYQSRFGCTICLERKDGWEGVQLDCDHSFCKKCFKEYASSMIEGDVVNLQCPNCPYEKPKNLGNLSQEELKAELFKPTISLKALREVLSEDQVEKYESLRAGILFEKYVRLFPVGASLCPHCSTWMFRDDENDLLIVCERCSFAYCFYCLKSWHGPFNQCKETMQLPSEIIDRILDESLSKLELDKIKAKYGIRAIIAAKSVREHDLLFLKAMEKDKSMVACPWCKVVITKSDGCNKMKCIMCFCQFCYLCGQSLDICGPYNHFSDKSSPCFNRLFDGIEGDGLGMLEGAMNA